MLRSYVSALALGLAGVGVTHAQIGTTQDAENVTVNPRWCRGGAFLDAIVIMNSSMRAHAALTAVDAQTTKIAAAELGAILNIALKQAVAEYHCVEGKLPLSYAQNYGDTLRSAIATAKRMRVSKSTIESADGLLAQLDLAASVQRTK
jgi:hypothetical protein